MCELGLLGKHQMLTTDKILGIGETLVMASFVLKIYFMRTEGQISAEISYWI